MKTNTLRLNLSSSWILFLSLLALLLFPSSYSSLYTMSQTLQNGHTSGWRVQAHSQTALPWHASFKRFSSSDMSNLSISISEENADAQKHLKARQQQKRRRMQQVCIMQISLSGNNKENSVINSKPLITGQMEYSPYQRKF